MKCIFKLIVFTLISVQGSFAINCKSSKSLSHLVANSDAISLIQIKDVDLLINRGRFDPLVAIVPLENFKAPLVVAFPKQRLARIFSKYLDWNTVRRYSSYLAFMDFQDGAWVPKECGLLPMTHGQKIKGACELISDLFNETPFKREKLCTLIHPNYIPLNTLKSEIAKRTLDEVSFEGRARVVKVEPFRAKNRFYRIYVELTGRDRARFFGLSKMNDLSPIKVLFKVDTKQDAKAYSRLFVGSSIKLNGFWTMGNFVLNSID